MTLHPCQRRDAGLYYIFVCLFKIFQRPLLFQGFRAFRKADAKVRTLSRTAKTFLKFFSENFFSRKPGRHWRPESDRHRPACRKAKVSGRNRGSQTPVRLQPVKSSPLPCRKRVQNYGVWSTWPNFQATFFKKIFNGKRKRLEQSGLEDELFSPTGGRQMPWEGDFHAPGTPRLPPPCTPAGGKARPSRRPGTAVEARRRKPTSCHDTTMNR